jgi:hypothetical protein
MLTRIVLGAVVTMAAANATGCGSKGKAGAMDTTKDVYTDEEAPKVQVRVVNGVETQVPWSQVPEAERWFVELDESGHYKRREPIVRVVISGHGCNTNVQRIGVNPNHVRISDSFCNH